MQAIIALPQAVAIGLQSGYDPAHPAQNPAPQWKTPESIFFTYLKSKNKIDNERRLTDKLNRIITWLKQDDELQKMGIVLTPEVLISEGIRKRNGNLYTPAGIRRAFTAN